MDELNNQWEAFYIILPEGKNNISLSERLPLSTVRLATISLAAVRTTAILCRPQTTTSRSNSISKLWHWHTRTRKLKHTSKLQSILGKANGLAKCVRTKADIFLPERTRLKQLCTEKGPSWFLPFLVPQCVMLLDRDLFTDDEWGTPGTWCYTTADHSPSPEGRH